MNRKTVALMMLVVVGSLLAGIFLVGRNRSRPGITVTLRIAVSPREQSDFVIAQANSARFKYLVGKQSGVKPVLAQKLAVKSVPNSAVLEAQLGVLTREEARRYVAAFLPTLQDQCGARAQVALAEQSIR